MKVCIIGAGSSYTPEIVEGLYKKRDVLPVTEVALYDIDELRLDAVHGFCRRYAEKLGLKTEFNKYTDRKKALEGSTFVNAQIRVGGNAARARDERICIDMGVIGQETTGAGGMMKALRTIPAMIDIANDVSEICPDAWIINYSNPTGIVTEAVLRETKAKIAGLCAGGMIPQSTVGAALGVNPGSVRYDMAGLNHLSFAYNITVGGRNLTCDEYKKVFGETGYKYNLGVLPIGYLGYYYHTSGMLKHLREAPQVRGEMVMELEKAVFRDFNDVSVCDKPESLAKRGGGGYSELALGVMGAIYNNTDGWFVVNVPNGNTLDFLSKDAVIETPCMVNASGIRPIAADPPPRAIRGLISAVKAYEQLTVDAAVTGNSETAIMALTVHPLVGDYDVACELWQKLFEINKEYLPQFKGDI